jgi:hypothetical protein
MIGVRRTAVVLLVALVVGAGTGVLAYRIRRDEAATTPSTSRVPSRPLDRAHAIARVTKLTAEVKRVDRVEARLAMASAIPPPMPVRPGQEESDYCIWVVAVAGDLATFSGTHTQWAVYKLNAISGVVLGTTAGPGCWPVWWDDLPDSC